MNIFSQVKELITHSLPNAEVEVTDLTGTKDHLEIVVKSDVFKGKKMIQQHQIVMDILKEKLHSGEIHAVKIQTKTPK